MKVQVSREVGWCEIPDACPGCDADITKPGAYTSNIGTHETDLREIYVISYRCKCGYRLA